MACLGKLRYYGQNTNLHGLRHVADESNHPFYRFIWFVIFAMMVAAMSIVIMQTYWTYRNNAISFVTETTYLNWNTTFPAVTICEMAADQVFVTPGPNESFSAAQEFITDIIFFTGSCYSCNTPCEECKKFNLRQLAIKYKKPCREVLGICNFNNRKFDCCEKFLPIDSEYGTCFAINSIHTKHGLNTKMLQSNRKTGPGELLIEALVDVRLYFHAPEDVPFINSDPDHRKDTLMGEAHNITINIIEIKNDEYVQNLPVEQRQCLFPWEKPEEIVVHKYYSYSTCVVQCHADNHLKLCNCTHHLMPVMSENKSCGIDGLMCLTDKFETVNRLHAKGFDKAGLVCDCLPSCTEPEYKVVAESKDTSSKNIEIAIKMQALPTSRFKRIVVRTTLDLVGSIGGAFGLFIGGSLLSIIETLYLLLIRS